MLSKDANSLHSLKKKKKKDINKNRFCAPSSYPKVQKDCLSTSETFDSEDITTTKRISHDRGNSDIIYTTL